MRINIIHRLTKTILSSKSIDDLKYNYNIGESISIDGDKFRIIDIEHDINNDKINIEVRFKYVPNFVSLDNKNIGVTFLEFLEMYSPSNAILYIKNINFSDLNGHKSKIYEQSTDITKILIAKRYTEFNIDNINDVISALNREDVRLLYNDMYDVHSNYKQYQLNNKMDTYLSSTEIKEYLIKYPAIVPTLYSSTKERLNLIL